MAKTWQEHGKNMARAWQKQSTSMAKTWQEHGKKTWQEHGTKTWQEHGKDISLPFQNLPVQSAWILSAKRWRSESSVPGIHIMWVLRATHPTPPSFNFYFSAVPCKSMAIAWQEHGNSMARGWQEHGKSMVRAWQEHGKNMARAWQ